MSKKRKRPREKRLEPKQHPIPAAPVALGHPTLTSQFHKNVHDQNRQSRITRDEPYLTPRDWAPPRG